MAYLPKKHVDRPALVVDLFVFDQIPLPLTEKGTALRSLSAKELTAVPANRLSPPDSLNLKRSHSHPPPKGRNK